MLKYKDIITTIVGVLMVVGTAIQTVLSKDGVDVWQVLIAVGVAVVGYFTGKKSE